MKILAIIGSRNFDRYEYFERYMLFFYPNVDFIITGDARGTNSLAIRYAEKHGVPYRSIRAEWNKFGGGAGHIRSKDILDPAKKILAWWDNKSPGTRWEIKYAKEIHKVPEIVFWPVCQIGCKSKSYF